MKNYNKLFVAVAAGLFATSCAESDIETYFPVEKPESIANSEYLLALDNIKDYVDRGQYPNFKIACAIGAQDYVDRGTVYRVANANFDEITLGNAMKYASVVQDDGSMDFSLIEDLLEATEGSGMSVYGHTLAWHSQQNTTWLKGCISGKTIPSYEIEDYAVNFADWDEYPFTTEKTTPKIENGVAVIEATGNSPKIYLLENMATVPGQEYIVRLSAKCDGDKNVSVKFYQNDDTKTKISFKSDWTDIKITFTAQNDNSFILIEPARVKMKLEIESVKVSHMTPNRLDLTEDEKTDTLTKEMNRWVDAMMQACAGRVKAWDLINEAISGDGAVDGKYYDLWSAATGSSSDFFWQDYLGNENYGPIVSKAAREAWKKYGGADGDLKLFVNDYNLESDWDNNRKLESMIYWVNLWNKKGATIDGLGSQMHVSYYENKAVMKSKADHVVRMLHLMADTKMLVRISELDMGYVDADGKDVKTIDLTKEQLQNMANYYQFIIQMYLKIVPKEQQYSICQWCLTDSPKGSGWRAETPVGLWDLNWNRKAAYAAYCAAFTTDMPSTEDFFEYLTSKGLTHYVTPVQPD